MDLIPLKANCLAWFPHMQYAHFALSTFKVIWSVHLGCEGIHSYLLGENVICDYKLCFSQPQSGDLPCKPKVQICPIRGEAGTVFLWTIPLQGTRRPWCEAHHSLDFLVCPGPNLCPSNTSLLVKAHAHISQSKVYKRIQFYQLPASKKVLRHFSVVHGQFCLDWNLGGWS